MSRTKTLCCSTVAFRRPGEKLRAGTRQAVPALSPRVAMLWHLCSGPKNREGMAGDKVRPGGLQYITVMDERADKSAHFTTPD